MTITCDDEQLIKLIEQFRDLAQFHIAASEDIRAGFDGLIRTIESRSVDPEDEECDPVEHAIGILARECERHDTCVRCRLSSNEMCGLKSRFPYEWPFIGVEE